MEETVSGQPFALIMQKCKTIPPLYEAKAARLDNLSMQVVPRNTSHTATDSKGHPATRIMDRSDSFRTAFLNHCVRPLLNVQFDDNRTYAYAPDQPETLAAAPRSAANLRPQMQIAASQDPAEEWHARKPLAQYERELDASYETAQ